MGDEDGLRLDPVFTPPALADRMAGYVTRDDAEVVIDPAVGDGALLHSAERRWPYTKLVGADIDGSRTSRLAAVRSSWLLQQGDLLDLGAHRCLMDSVAIYRTRIVLLNPPFSARGGSLWSTTVSGGRILRSSRGMAFLLRATEIAGALGQVVAVMPAGALTSQRDASARQWLREMGEFETVDEPERGTFGRVAAATAVIRWTPLRGATSRPSVEARECRPERLTVVRGTRQMHTVVEACGPGTVQLVHTTHLRDGEVGGTRSWILPGPRERIVRAPAVLLPRVGRPQVAKICVLRRGRIIPSDCVFGVLCHGADQAEELATRLRDDFAAVRDGYGGTGAPYLTNDRLAEILDRVD